jgi:hypothetical protein
VVNKWGIFAKKFDELMMESKGEWVNKKDLAEQLGTTYKNKAFMRLVRSRRSGKKPIILVHGRNPDLIKFINRDYVEAEQIHKPGQWINAKLPFDLQNRIKLPAGSVCVVAGFKDAGKTAFFLELAETVLNSTDMQVYYWFNEFSLERFYIRLEDFPNLEKMLGKNGRFHAVSQTDIEIKDVVEPDACNIYDYLRRTQDFYLHSKDIDDIAKGIGNGMLWLGLQKTNDAKTGYGGTPTMWLPNIYLNLDVTKNLETGIEGKCTIRTAKDYVNRNPKDEYCKYTSGGKHGRLYSDGTWWRG